MARTGFWFQFARGRAIARANAMKKARMAKYRLDRGGEHIGGQFFPWTKGQIAHFQHEVAWQVRRAREAHREHRKYRKLHVQSGD